jgi:hypothetical protein
VSTKGSAGSGWLRWPTIGSVWAAIAVGVPVAAAYLGRTMAIDLAYQIRAGDLMLQGRTLLDVDVFTFTVAGQPWLNQQWSAQVVLASVFGIGEWDALAILRGIVLGATLAFLFLACRGAGASMRTAAFLTVGGWLVGIEILPELRPQAFAFLLFAVCLWALATRRAHPGRIWIVPILVVPWANIHGSFPLVFVLLGFAWLEDRRAAPTRARRLVLAAALGVLASLLNPYGLRVWSYVVELSTHPIVSRRISEWGPPSIHSWSGRLFFVSLFAVLVHLARRGRPADWPALARLVAFAILSLLAIRGVVWWALVAPVVVAGLLADKETYPGEERSAIGGLVLAAIAVLLIVSLPIGRGTDPASGGPAVLRYAPEHLVSLARDRIPAGGRVFVSQLYASWSEFSAPELPVFVDARIEIFPEEIWDEYYDVSEAREGWREILDRWDVRALVLHPDQASHLIEVLETDRGWERAGGDPSQGWVFVRAGSGE